MGINYNKISDKRDDKKIEPDQRPLRPNKLQKYMVTSDRLNLRVKPSKISNVLYILERGDILIVKEIKDGWANVYSEKNDIHGFVMDDYINKQ